MNINMKLSNNIDDYNNIYQDYLKVGGKPLDGFNLDNIITIITFKIFEKKVFKVLKKFLKKFKKKIKIRKKIKIKIKINDSTLPDFWMRN